MSIYDLPVKTADGTETTLEPYRGQVMLIVNVASKCGLTPQYEALEAMYRAHKDEGLAVLGFPCNQFAGQEPGTAEEIASFCSLTYDVTFPIFGKIDVNGSGAAPLYQFLKKEAPGLLGSEAIKWNFTKFLIDREGNVAGRTAPQTDPAAMEKDVQALLAKG